jgi:hypothetical protein
MANFIHQVGTGGYMGSAVSLIAGSELSNLGNNNTVTSTGSFSQSNFVSSPYAYLMLTVVTAGWNVIQSGANIVGWFLLSEDGLVFESTITNTALPRPPDFIIPLPLVSPIATGRYFAAGPAVPLPWSPFKVYLQNYTGSATSVNNHTLKALPVADTFA